MWKKYLSGEILVGVVRWMAVQACWNLWTLRRVFDGCLEQRVRMDSLEGNEPMKWGVGNATYLLGAPYEGGLKGTMNP
jgi:hypothetical protein